LVHPRSGSVLFSGLSLDKEVILIDGATLEPAEVGH
jgi:hypothetical protein